MALTRAQRIVLQALTDEFASTSQLYDRLGYPALLRAQLIDYRAFREVLVSLEKADLALSEPLEDGGTAWRAVPAGR